MVLDIVGDINVSEAIDIIFENKSKIDTKDFPAVLPPARERSGSETVAEVTSVSRAEGLRTEYLQ